MVAAAHAAGVPVQPVPGASAVTAIVSAAGFEGEGFVFVGFAPSRSNHRKYWLRGLRSELRPIVLYEAPHRIGGTLADIQAELGERRVGIGRELTKLHEELAIRPIIEWLQLPPRAVGEFVLIIAPPEEPESAGEAIEPERLAEHFWLLTNNEGLGRREAMRRVATRYKVRVRDVFAAVEVSKKSVE